MAELDPAFEEYRRRWGALLNLSGNEAAQAFMRGEALDLAGDGQLERKPGRVALHLRVNGRGVDCAAEPGAFPGMIADWEKFLCAAPPSDPREYAKQVIVRIVGANLHLDPDFGPMALCAALWLATPEAVAALGSGEGALLCEITIDHSTGAMRTRLGVIDDD